jgi:hypothetical protein
MTAKSSEFENDDRGAILLIAVFFAVFAVAILYSLIGTAEAVSFREGLQDRADRTALSASIMHARAMNLIVLINIIMAAVLAILVALKLVELLAIVGMIIAAGLAWITFGATLAAIPPLKSLQQTMSQVYGKLKDPVYSALEVLHNVADAVKTVTPVAATAAFASENGIAVPTRLTLPVEDDEFEALCGRAGELAVGLAFLPLDPVPALGELRGPLSSAAGEMTEALSQWFCGDGSGSPPSYSTKVKKSYPFTTDDEECKKSGQSSATSQSTSEDVCSRSTKHQQAAKPDDKTGSCRDGEDCSATGPYETRVALARDQCDPTKNPKPFKYYYQQRHVSVQYEWTGEHWKRLEPHYDEPRRIESGRPPCGPRQVAPTLAEGYNRVVRSGMDVSEVRPVCSTERPPAVNPRERPQKGKRITVEYDEVSHILGCVTEVKETMQISDAESGGDGGDDKSPKKLEADVRLGGEDFQIRSLVRDDLDKLRSRRLVRLALWDRPDPENPLSELRRFANVGFAQAEYFYDGDEDREAWMWNMKWRARLVRFRLSDDSETLSALKSVCGSDCGILSTLTDLESLIAH